jgi:nickel-dependent lactate racemase
VIIDMPWGKGHISVQCPNELVPVVVRRPADRAPQNWPPQMDDAAKRSSPETILLQALDEPLGGAPSFPSFLDDYGSRLTIVVNDATRPTPSGRVLTEMKRHAPELLSARQTDRRVIIATGAHQPGGRDDLEHIFGPILADLAPRSIIWHDAHDPDTHASLGVTERGTPVHVDRAVTGASGILVINSVEPHYFAGYTGGRKSLVPGCAAESTISTNHRLALQPEAVALRLAGNPVHEDLEEAVSLLSDIPIFSVQVVLGASHNIVAACCGDLSASFAEATRAADREFTVDLPERFDVVVAAVPHPMDYDLYQAQKGIDHGALAVKDSGILILVSTCRNGVGGRAFFDLLASADSPRRALAHIEESWVLGYHKAARVAQVAERVRLWGVTELDPSAMAAAFVRPFSSVSEALAAAALEAGPGGRVLFLLDAALTVPRITPEAVPPA